MSLPQTMRAIAIAEPGGPDALRGVELARPVPGPDDILIRVAAAGVNGPDLAQRRGRYDPPPGASPLPGLEVAGIVAARGANVESLAPGQRVMALANGGGYAEYVAVPAGQALPVPRGWTLAEAAALPETWFTVIQTLVMRAGLAGGMHVLVHGASGGIGGAAIQICAIAGARAIAVVSSPEKAAYCRQLGAVATIERTREDLVERVMALTGDKGADRVVDLLGGATAPINIALSARRGHIVQIATLESATASLSLRAMMAKELTLSGSTLRPQDAATKAAIAARFARDFLPALGRPDWIRPKIERFALDDAAAAHRRMESRSHTGKMVLVTAFGAHPDGS